MKFLFCLCFIFGAFYAQAQEQVSFYFDSDKFVLSKGELAKLDQWIGKNKEAKVIGVHGFCDEDGSIGYNDTLAQKRINQVFNLIKNKVKTREDFKTKSFGKLHQLSTVKAQNRKVSLFYILPTDFVNEEKIIAANNPPPPKKLKVIPKFPQEYLAKNPDGSSSSVKMDTLFMRRISTAKIGEKINLKNMHFFLDTFAIIPQSRPVMYELLTVMESCPELKIQIQGHICCVSKDYRNLSTQRAKAIYKFLELNGIGKNRMSFVGFGSTKPLYPIPENNEAEREANRRVEIEIIGN